MKCKMKYEMKFIVSYWIAKCIREIVRGSIVPLFNDEWIDLRSNEMFVQ